MKAVMYHYVRKRDEELPNLRYLLVDDFRRQLDYFQQCDRFVSLNEFWDVLGGAPIPADGIILTFDDGLCDHYQFVFPELLSRGIAGFFYVPTSIFERRDLLGVHAIHVLTAKVSGVQLLGQLEAVLGQDAVRMGLRGKRYKSAYARQDGSDALKSVKRFLNYSIEYENRDAVLRELMRINEIEIFADQYYLTRKQIREMHKCGMLIGSHSVSHRVLSRLPEKEQKAEIFESFECLQNLVGDLALKSFCFPYGGGGSFDYATTRLLGDAGCRFSFSVEHRDFEPRDFMGRSLALPRYDCNNFPYGKAQ